MFIKHPVFAMYGHKKAWLDHIDQHFKLLFRGMSRNMDAFIALMNDRSAQTEQIIYCFSDRALIAGDWRSGNDYCIPWHDLNLPVLTACHARQTTQRFPL